VLSLGQAENAELEEKLYSHHAVGSVRAAAANLKAKVFVQGDLQKLRMTSINDTPCRSLPTHIHRLYSEEFPQSAGSAQPLGEVSGLL
jgi:hypothetical protein